MTPDINCEADVKRPRKLRIQILCNNLRIKSNVGTMKAATADFTDSIFLGSAFYSFTQFMI